MDDEAQVTPETRELILAYKRVFGTDGARTKAQRLVWEDMLKRWAVEGPSFVANSHTLSSANELKTEVTYDPIKAALTDGAKLPIFQIMQFLRSNINKPDKPNVKK